MVLIKREKEEELGNNKCIRRYNTYIHTYIHTYVRKHAHRYKDNEMSDCPNLLQ